MPPKSKSKKKAEKVKSSAVVDGLSTEEMSKDQLEEHIIRLREELDREREERSFFQLERDNIQALWEISKRSLEETKGEMRNGQREREEAEERHRVEITVYKQKLKHVLSEQHNTVSELKMDRIAANSLIHCKNTESELELRGEVHGLQADLRKKKLYNENCIKELKLKHQVELMEMTNDYVRRIRDIEVTYHHNLQTAVAAEKKKQSDEILELEDRWKWRMTTLEREHQSTLTAARIAHNEAQEREEEQQRLKKQLLELNRELARKNRKISAASEENKRLLKSLQEAKDELPEIKTKLEDYKKARGEMVLSRARQKVVEQELKDLSVEHELLLQAFEKVQQERDDLLKKQTEAILDIQQRCGLKEMLLERKLAALTETLEKKDAQLCAALSASNIEQTAASSAVNKLQETLESKRVTISALKEDLARGCQEYDGLLHESKEQLKALGVPLYDVPFRPSDQILGGGPEDPNPSGDV